MDTLRYSDSLTVAQTPEALYDLVADVTRMGGWSPICKACWWDDGEGPEVGAHFTGRNELPERTWETRSVVVAADPGREFAFVVEMTGTRWGYTFSPAAGGTELTESWEFPQASIDFFEQRFGDDAEAQIAVRQQAARDGIRATLAAIKATAEAV